MWHTRTRSRRTALLVGLPLFLTMLLASLPARPLGATSMWPATSAPASATCADAPVGLLSATATTSGTTLAVDVLGSYAYVGEWGSGLSGQSTAGALYVFDVSDPCAPLLSGTAQAGTPQSNELHDLVVRDTPAGRRAYLANDANGLAVYNVSNPAQPSYESSHSSSGGSMNGPYAHAIAYDGGQYAYVGQSYANGSDLAIYDMTAFPAAPTIYAPSFSAHRDIYSVAVSPGRAYLLAGDGSGNDHVQILDTTAPTKPALLGDLPLPSGTYGGVGDLRVQGAYIYIATGVDGSVGHPGGLIVIDIADELHPKLAGSAFLPDAGNIPWIGASLTVSGARAYVVTRSGLAAFDISNPAQPRLASRYPFPMRFGASLGGRVVVKDNLAYVTAYRDPADSASTGGLAIYKLEPSPAQVCDPATEGLKGFVRSATGSALGVGVVNTTAYVGDWDDGAGSGVLNAIDVSNPCRPQLQTSLRTLPNEIGDLAAQGTSVYLANDGNGLVRYDVSEPTKPISATGRLDGAYAHSVFVDGGRYAYVGQIYSSGSELAIYDLAAFPAAAPTIYAPSFSGHRDVYDVQVAAGRAYILAGDGSGNTHLQILAVADPTKPALLSDLALPLGQYGDVGELRVQGGYVYLATGGAAAHAGGLVVIDVANPAAPQVAASLFTPDAASVPWKGAGLELAGQRALLPGRSGLHSIDISDPRNPVAGATYAFPADFGPALGGHVAVKGGLAYVTVYRDQAVAGSQGGLAIYKLDRDIDIGFRPSPDGYSFANYGDVAASDYTIEDMRRDFGDAAVCVTTTPTCQPSQAALAWNQSVNEMLAGGHCDGMASTSLRFFKGLESPASYQLGATRAYDLLKGNARRLIASYAAKQMSSPLGDYRWYSTQNPPSIILAQLRASMLGGAPNPMTLAIWQKDVGGHAITPYAIEERGGGVFWVKVYDNNHPGDSGRHVIIDTANETWSYDLGGMLWSGDVSTQSLALTPISLYAAPQICPFCSGSSLQVGQVWLDGPGHLLISDSQGRRVGYVGDQLVNEVPGARQIRMVGDVGQAHEPIYTLPLTATYTIQLDGSAAGQSGPAAVAQFGPGYAMAAEGLQVGPSTHSQLSFAADGTRASYSSDTPGAATLTLAQDSAGSSHRFSVAGAGVAAGQALTMQLDSASGQIVISGAQAGSAYDLAITRVSVAGAQTFAHHAVAVAAADTSYVNYGAWDGAGTVTVQIDHGSDGTIDETLTLENQHRVYLPLVWR